LEELQKSSQLDFQQKKWLKDELHRYKKGIQGERDSAHYLDSHFKDGENNVLLHDLRFLVDGEVAQIDHLVLNRTGHVFLIETKNYSGDLLVNEHGEFTVQYEHDAVGVPSPWEQSRRHERILAKLLENLGLTGRVDKQPTFHHVVMMHPKSIIKRPEAKLFDTSFLIKADQFPSWHAKFADKLGAGAVFKALLNIRSLETLVDWGEKLKRQHRPSDLLELPDFMRPKAKIEEQPPVASLAPVQAIAAPPAAAKDAPEKKLICAHCGSKISYPKGKFCWNNSKRFNGLQYCRDHQSLF
jgi:hypothetical protein